MGAGVRAARRADRRRAAGRAVRGVRRAGPARARAAARLRAPPTGCSARCWSRPSGSASSGSSARSRCRAGSYRMREEVQRSAILQRLNTILPPSGPLLNSLRALDPFPRIDGPQARVARAARRHRARPGGAGGGGERRQGARHARAASASRARAGSRATGSWSRTRTSSPAQRDTRVLLGGREPGRRAQAVHFDPRNDLAILRVDGLDARPLPLADDTDAGTSAAILGFPLNGPFDVRPGRLGQTRRVRSSDAYGRGPGRALDDRAARARALGQLGRADGRRRGPRRHDDLRRHDRAARAAATACPNAVVARALGAGRRAGVDRPLRRG